MSFATLMVHVELDDSSDRRIGLAARLTQHFNAVLIGIAGWAPRPPLTYGGVVVDHELTKDNLQDIVNRLDACGNRFRARAGAPPQLEWRSAVESPTELLIREARAADLLIVNRDRHGDLYQSLDPGGVILRAGRPVLAVPPDVHSLQGDRVVVAWKDTREARRALRDALPLLRRAKKVCIVEVTEAGGEDQVRAHLDDVAAYLARHRITVTAEVTAHAAASPADELMALAKAEDADLIVAGAYGHSRIAELVFGGVTRDLLAAAPVCCLFSH